MPISKTHLYPEDYNRLAQILQAVGHGARLCILRHLKALGRANNKELTEQLTLCQSSVSSHLSTLRDAGIITATQIENAVYYQLSSYGQEIIQNLSAWQREG